MTEPVIDIRDRIEKMRNQMTVPASKVSSTEIKVENKSQESVSSDKAANINVENLELPEADNPRLSMIKSNNYKRIYHTNMPLDRWDTTNCPYEQMGPDNEPYNRNNLDKCVIINNRTYKKSYVKTFKNTVFNRPYELSVYTAFPYKNDNNQIFYPVGSVWRAKADKEKPVDAERSPPANNICGVGRRFSTKDKSENLIAYDEGPEKETILVSGDVVDPIDYKLLWDNQKGCKKCGDNDFVNFKIYRPIAPKGYIALGDVGIDNFSDPVTENRNTLTIVELSLIHI